MERHRPAVPGEHPKISSQYNRAGTHRPRRMGSANGCLCIAVLSLHHSTSQCTDRFSSLLQQHQLHTAPYSKLSIQMLPKSCWALGHPTAVTSSTQQLPGSFPSLSSSSQCWFEVTPEVKQWTLNAVSHQIFAPWKCPGKDRAVPAPVAVHGSPCSCGFSLS